MRVKNINSNETNQYLINKGFKVYKSEQINCWAGAEYYCWFNGESRHGNESPTLIIDKETGDVWFKFAVTYIQREVPDVLMQMIQEGKIEESEEK